MAGNGVWRIPRPAIWLALAPDLRGQLNLAKQETLVALEQDEDNILREFDALASRAQLQIPDDRRAGLLNGYRELRHMVALLRIDLTPDLEPASTFDIAAVAKVRS